MSHRHPLPLTLQASLLLLLLALLTACSPAPQTASSSTGLNVVATTTIVGDLVRQIGGEQVKLTVLLPVGADPHSFEAAPEDVARLTRADLIFAAGGGLEAGFLERLVANAGAEDRLVELSEGLPLASGDGHEGEDQDHDEAANPHVWFDPALVKLWVDRLAAELSELDPGNAALYAERASAYKAQLDDLDGWIREQIETLPPDRRVLVSDHYVLTYFAARYGLQEVGAITSSFSTAAQSGARDLARLEDAIRSSGVPVIFVSTTVNPALAERVAEDTGAAAVPLYIDSLSDTDGPAANYLEFMRHNVRVMVSALSR